MAPRSSIDLLPEEVRHALERKLTESGFSDYRALADWLQAQGYQISRSAVHRYGQKVERRFASIKASTEAARLIAEGAADEGDTRSEALMAMLQTELFDALVQIGEIPDTELNPIERLGMMSELYPELNHQQIKLLMLKSGSDRLLEVINAINSH